MSDFSSRFCAARRACIARDFAKLNPEQRRGVLTTEGALLLLAGAGSGKTTVLINHVANLLTYGRGSDSADVPAWATEDDLAFLESYPALFGGVERITVLPDEFDDRCALYLRVLNDLWGKDEGLNSSGVEYISVDLAATSLTPAERSAVAWTFAQAHDAMPLELNYEQLCEEGYISGLEGEDIFPAWENGVLFTITETDDSVTFNLPSLSEGGELPSMTQYNIKNTVSFDASKWRTALGAYGFSECVAAQDNSGVWGDYRINGPEWIS